MDEKMTVDILAYNYILERSDNVSSAIVQKFMPKLENNLMKTSMRLPELIQASPEFLNQVIDHLLYKYMLQINYQDAEDFRKEFKVFEWCEISRDLGNIVKAAPQFQDITNEVREQMQEINVGSSTPTPAKTTSKNTKRPQKAPATTINSSSNLRKTPVKTLVKQSTISPYKSTPKKYSKTNDESDDDSDYAATITVPVSYRNSPESKPKRYDNANKVSKAFNDKGIVDQHERCEISPQLGDIVKHALQFREINDDSPDEHACTCKQKKIVSSKERETLMTLQRSSDSIVSIKAAKPPVKAPSKNTKRPQKPAATTISSSSNLSKTPAETSVKQSANSPFKSILKKCGKTIDESDDDSDYSTTITVTVSYGNSPESRPKRNDNSNKVSKAFNDKGIVEQRERLEISPKLMDIVNATQFREINDDSSDEPACTCKEKKVKLSANSPFKSTSKECGKKIDESDVDSENLTTIAVPVSYGNASDKDIIDPPKLENNLMKTSMRLPELIQASPEFLNQVIDHLLYKYMLQINYQDAEDFRKEFKVFEWCEISRDLGNIVKAAPQFQDITNEVREQMQEINVGSSTPTPAKTTSKNTKRPQKAPATTINSSSNLRKTPVKTLVKQSTISPYKSTPKKYSKTNDESDDDSDYAATKSVPVSYRKSPESKPKRNDSSDKHAWSCKPQKIVSSKERETLLILKCSSDNTVSIEADKTPVKAPSKNTKRPQKAAATTISTSKKRGKTIDESDDDSDHSTRITVTISFGNSPESSPKRNDNSNKVSKAFNDKGIDEQRERIEISPQLVDIVNATQFLRRRRTQFREINDDSSDEPACTCKKKKAKLSANSPFKCTECGKKIDESDVDSENLTTIAVPVSYGNTSDKDIIDPLQSAKKKNVRAARGREKEAEIDVNNKKVKFDFGGEIDNIKEEKKKNIKKNLEF